MLKSSLLLICVVTCGVGVYAFAQDHGAEPKSLPAAQQHGGESVKLLAVRDIQEKLDGQAAAATAVLVTIAPGEAGAPHRHPGPVLVYVLEGEYELGIDDQPTKLYKAGETFYEPTGCLHRVSKNPAAKGTTRLLAWVLHPRDAKDVAVQEKMKH
ncbi:MAG: cupin domain-containing protein [Pirellulales bacterium]